MTLLPERVEHLAWSLADLSVQDSDSTLARVLRLALAAGEAGRLEDDAADLIAARPPACSWSRTTARTSTSSARSWSIRGTA